MEVAGVKQEGGGLSQFSVGSAEDSSTSLLPQPGQVDSSSNDMLSDNQLTDLADNGNGVFNGQQGGQADMQVEISSQQNLQVGIFIW